jgi:hypothetical protein
MSKFAKQLAVAAGLRPRRSTAVKQKSIRPRLAAINLAAEHGVDIQSMRPGFNVWPPKDLPDDADEYSGDHYVNEWDEVLERVKAYVEAKARTADQATKP